jgi:hypothetical protein
MMQTPSQLYCEMFKKVSNKAAGDAPPQTYPEGTLRMCASRERSWGNF